MAAVPLDGLEETVRSRESNWANFIVDQMRRAFGEENADLAFINGGTLRIDDIISDATSFSRMSGVRSDSVPILRYTTMTRRRIQDRHGGRLSRRTGNAGLFPAGLGFSCLRRPKPERVRSHRQPAGAGGQTAGRKLTQTKTYSVVVQRFSLWRWRRLRHPEGSSGIENRIGAEVPCAGRNSASAGPR